MSKHMKIPLFVLIGALPIIQFFSGALFDLILGLAFAGGAIFYLKDRI